MEKNNRYGDKGAVAAPTKQASREQHLKDLSLH